MFDDLRALVEFAHAGSIAGAAGRLFRTPSRFHGGSEYDAVTRRAVPDRIDQTVEVPEGHQVSTVGEPRAAGSDF